jgi:hypothetical protein
MATVVHGEWRARHRVPSVLMETQNGTNEYLLPICQVATANAILRGNDLKQYANDAIRFSRKLSVKMCRTTAPDIKSER